MLPAAITVIILLAALAGCFLWLHSRIAKLEEESTEHSRWIVEREMETRTKGSV